MAGPTGRERHWDINLGGTAYRVVRDEKGVPVWRVRNLPATAGKDVELFQRERRYETWHLGAGYTDIALEGGYSYALSADCFVPETWVTALSPLRAAARRWFKGEVVHITTASGHGLTASPNHPVLTDRGWVRLGFLQEGDNVVRYIGTERMSLGLRDTQYVDAPIGEVFNLASVSGLTERITGSTEQFHGDGQDGQVDVVTVNGQLRDRVQPNSTHPGDKFGFSASHQGQTALKSKRLVDAPVRATSTLTDGPLHGHGHRTTFLERHLGNLDAFSLALATEHARLNEDASNDSFVGTAFVGQLPLRGARDIPLDDRGSNIGGQNLRRVPLSASTTNVVPVSSGVPKTHALPLCPKNAGSSENARNSRLPDAISTSQDGRAFPMDIAFDNITHIEWQPFEGHVYNLNTESEWYLADTIIVHNCRFPRQILPGPFVTPITDAGATAITAFFEQSGNLYFLKGRYCKRINLADDTIPATNNGSDGCDFDDNATFGDGTGHVASIGVNFDGNTIVGFTSAGHHIFKFTGSAWSKATDSVKGAYAAKWWSENADDWVLVGVPAGTPQVVTCAQGGDPTAALSWSAAIDIGDTSNAITAVAGSEKTLWVAKTDGLYYLHLSQTPRVLETKVLDSTNGTNLMVDAAGMVYYPCKEAYYRYDPATGAAEDISPGRGLPNSLSLGPISAHTTYKGWIYAATWDGTTAYIVCGRAREGGEAGIGSVLWHGSLTPGLGGKITCMHVTGLTTTPRLFYGAADGKPRYVKLPASGDNPLLDSNYAYYTLGQAHLSFDHFGVPGSRWELMSIEFDTKNLDANTTITADVFYDGDASSLGLPLGTLNTSPRQVLTVPTSVTTLSADLASGGASLTVASAVGFPSSNGWYIKIDNEILRVTAGSGTTTWTVSRAQRGTSAAAHSTGAAVVSDNRFTTLMLRLTYSLQSSSTPAVIKGITLYAVQRPTVYQMLTAQLYCSDRVASRFGEGPRTSGKQQLTNLRAMQTDTFRLLKDWWTGSERQQTVLVGPVQEIVVKQEGDDAVDAAAEVQIAVIA